MGEKLKINSEYINKKEGGYKHNQKIKGYNEDRFLGSGLVIRKEEFDKTFEEETRQKTIKGKDGKKED